MWLEEEKEEIVGKKLNELEHIIMKSLDSYNRYRSPEANAKLLKHEGNLIKVEFSGPFCNSCDVYSYFEDFVIELNVNKVKPRINSIKRKKNDVYEVDFLIE